ncbi:DUF6292 family protein [Streptomyces sp. NPDC058301]|uniref:DUF6292 family protein n=1 Tax=Streptomyces sp. NPDC058301 TaxID=3346436 RepID=UPI0036E3E4AB
MIRAGRRDRVQTMAGLAAALGFSLGTLRNTKPYADPAHPKPISSPKAQALLWDSGQTAAYYAGLPVPALSDEDSLQDLLDRHEAAAELGVSVTTWNGYKHDPAVAQHLVVAGGVEHWPRGTVRAFRDSRPGQGTRHGTGRPRGSGDRVPRDRITPRIADLLDADPAVTAADVVAELGVAMTTAMKALAALRGWRIADLLEADPELTGHEAAERLGYPPITHRRALAAAETERRMREARPYVQQVADALAEAGLAEPTTVDMLELEGGALAAAVRLRPGQAFAALVWDQRFGWRTADSRRHPLGKSTGTRPQGPGIRYLLPDTRQPAPARLLKELTVPDTPASR